MVLFSAFSLPLQSDCNPVLLYFSLDTDAKHRVQVVFTSKYVAKFRRCLLCRAGIVFAFSPAIGSLWCVLGESLCELASLPLAPSSRFQILLGILLLKGSHFGAQRSSVSLPPTLWLCQVISSHSYLTYLFRRISGLMELGSIFIQWFNRMSFIPSSCLPHHVPPQGFKSLLFLPWLSRVTWCRCVGSRGSVKGRLRDTWERT